MKRLASACVWFLLACIPVICRGQAQSITGQAIDQFGAPLPFAQVRVCNAATSTGTPCTPTTPVFQDFNLTIPAANPTTGDQYGNYQLYAPALAAPNLYVVQLSPASGITWSYVFNGPGGGGGGIGFPPAGIPLSSGSSWLPSYQPQGTDINLLTSGTVTGSGSALCTDANGGATTVGCLSGTIGGSVSPCFTPYSSATNTLLNSPDFWDCPGLTTHTFVSTAKEIHQTPEFDINGTGGDAAAISLLQGAALVSLPVNTFTLEAPASIPTAYAWKAPPAQGLGAVTDDGSGNLGYSLNVGCTGTAGFFPLLNGLDPCVVSPVDYNVTTPLTVTSPVPLVLDSPSTNTTVLTMRGAGGGFATPSWNSGSTNTVGGFFSCSLNLTVAHNGDAILFWGFGAQTSATVGDGINTYTIIASSTAQSGVFEALAANVAAGTYGIVANNMLEVNQCSAEDRSGVDTVSPLDSVHITDTHLSSYPATSAALTTTFAHDVIVATAFAGDSMINPPSGYTANYTNSTAPQGSVLTAGQVVSSTGSFTSTWTSSASSVPNFIFMTALKAAGSTTQTADLGIVVASSCTQDNYLSGSCSPIYGLGPLHPWLPFQAGMPSDTPVNNVGTEVPGLTFDSTTTCGAVTGWPAYYNPGDSQWHSFCTIGAGSSITALTGDVTATGPGSATAETVGLLTHALPSLTTGFLNWTGSAWALSAAGGGSPAGVNGNVQINASGSFGAPANIFYAQTADTISSIETECSSPCTYVVSIPQTFTLGSSHTLNANVNVKFEANGSWTINGSTFKLTIPGQVSGTLSTHFIAGTGSESLGATNSVVPVEWFGAIGDWNGTTGTDNTTAIQTAITAMTSGSVLLQALAYKITSTLTISAPVVGIKGTKYGGSALDNNYSLTIATPHSRLIETSASADIVDLYSGSPGGILLSNEFRDFALDRVTLPTGTAAGLSMQYAGGTVVDHVVVNDSVRGFYCFACPALGSGAITNSVAQLGYGSLTETSGTYYGFYFDSGTSGPGEDSLRVMNSGASSKIASGITSYGMILTGSLVSDVTTYGFETENMTYGQAVISTGNASISATSDIHFTNSILNDCGISCVKLSAIQTASGGAVSIIGGLMTPSGTSGTTTFAVDIESSAGVSVEGVQIAQFNTSTNFFTAGVGAVSSSNIVIANNLMFNASAVAPVLLSSTNDSTITGNKIFNNFATSTQLISLTGTSAHNVISGNTLSGTATVGIAFGASTANNTLDNVLNIDPTSIITPVTDAGTNNRNQTVNNLTVLGTCTGCSGGSNVTVNGGSTLATANFNSTTPAAGAGFQNLPFQTSTTNVSVEAPLTSSSVFGLAKVDNTTIGASSGVISCTTGTTSQLGCLKPDGTTIGVSSGVISVLASPIANITIAVTGATQTANGCSSAATATMTGVTTSSHVTAAFTTNPTSLTGWGSSGGMVFDVWPSATNTVSWIACNQTTSSITFSSITFSIGAQ